MKKQAGKRQAKAKKSNIKRSIKLNKSTQQQDTHRGLDSGVWKRKLKVKTYLREEGNLLNMISSDVVGGIIGCHHGLHLHQVLLHYIYVIFDISPPTLSHTHSLTLSFSFSLYKNMWVGVFLSLDWIDDYKHCKLRRGKCENGAPQRDPLLLSLCMRVFVA